MIQKAIAVIIIAVAFFSILFYNKKNPGSESFGNGTKTNNYEIKQNYCEPGGSYVNFYVN